MALALEKPLHIVPACPETEEPQSEPQRLEITVIFTSLRPTLRAMRRAADLARRLGARIALVVPQVVPYPLPLASPPVLLKFNEHRFFAFAKESHVETTVRIYLCRDRAECVADMLRPHSIVFVGGQKRWWPTAESRLAKKLQRADHEVVFVEED
jgi:hypothetical protein